MRLRRLWPSAPFELYGKIEALNPGGSIKDRPARWILQNAIERGAVGQGTVVVESTSGNMGIGLAQACRYHGLRLVCVVDPHASETNLKILQAYGATIERVEERDPETGQYLPARLARVQDLLQTFGDAFWPNQYANEDNAAAHYESTVKEVVEALDGRLNFLFIATSTCGTLNGCSRYLRDQRLPTRVVAVDAKGSLIFGCRSRAERFIPGLGAGIRPPLSVPGLAHHHVWVSPLDCVVGARRLLQREAIFVGGSAGGVVTGVDRFRDRIPTGARCAALFADRGERYLDTIFSDSWVRSRFGEVADLWKHGNAT